MLTSLAAAPAVDTEMITWWPAHRIGALTPVMAAVSEIFSPAPAILIAICVSLLVARARRDRWAGAEVLASTALAMTLVVACKLVVARPRPPMWAQVGHETDASFPSGHVAGITVLAATTVLALWPLLRGRLARAVAVLCGVAVVALVAVSRLYLGAHWLSDVLAGLTIGTLGAVVGPPLFQRARRRVTAATEAPDPAPRASRVELSALHR